MSQEEFQKEMLKRFDAQEAFNQKVLKRFEQMDQRFDRLEKEMREGFQVMHAQLDDLQGQNASLAAKVITIPQLRRELREQMEEV